MEERNGKGKKKEISKNGCWSTVHAFVGYRKNERGVVGDAMLYLCLPTIAESTIRVGCECQTNEMYNLTHTLSCSDAQLLTFSEVSKNTLEK